MRLNLLFEHDNALARQAQSHNPAVTWLARPPASLRRLDGDSTGTPNLGDQITPALARLQNQAFYVSDEV